MSSPLYLAIVIVWAIVLVPMLLRRDAVDPAPWSTQWASLEEEDLEEELPEDAVEDGHRPEETRVLSYGYDERESRRSVPTEARSSAPEEASLPPAPRVTRARVIARRRRRTAGLVLLLVATVVAVIAGYGSWWVILPPVLLLAGHLALLREAARIDAERRAMAAEYRRRRAAARARRAAEAAREAEIIELRTRRDPFYDQYADAHLRAAGD